MHWTSQYADLCNNLCLLFIVIVNIFYNYIAVGRLRLLTGVLNMKKIFIHVLGSYIECMYN